MKDVDTYTKELEKVLSESLKENSLLLGSLKRSYFKVPKNQRWDLFGYVDEMALDQIDEGFAYEFDNFFRGILMRQAQTNYEEDIKNSYEDYIKELEQRNDLRVLEYKQKVKNLNYRVDELENFLEEKNNES